MLLHACVQLQSVHVLLRMSSSVSAKIKTQSFQVVEALDLGNDADRVLVESAASPIVIHVARYTLAFTH